MNVGEDKTMKKQLIAKLLVLGMVLTMLPTAALASANTATYASNNTYVSGSAGFSGSAGVSAPLKV